MNSFIINLSQVFVIEPSIYLRLIGSKDFFTLIAHAHIFTSERIESICLPRKLMCRSEFERTLCDAS